MTDDRTTVPAKGNQRQRGPTQAKSKMSSHNIERTKHVLESLIQGNDPVTGQELPPEAVVNRIEISRALLVSLTALKEQAVRAARRAQLPSGVGRTWSMDEETTLAAEFKRGESVLEIAKRHHRTVRAIETRLAHLGLITPDQWTTYNPFTATVRGKKGARKK